MSTALADLRKLAKSIPWWGWIIVAFLVFAGIGALGDSGSKNSSKTSATTSTTAAQTTTHGASRSKVRRLRSENGCMEKTASDFLKVPEAAAALGVSERTIRSWIATGHLPRIQPGGEHGAIRIDKADLLRSVRRSEVER